MRGMPRDAEKPRAVGRLLVLDTYLTGWRPWVLVALLGCVLYIPFLGSTGLWDPWEPHYAEVAREMVESGDWLHPTWEHSPGEPEDRKYFYSKPAGVMWLMALPMAVFGIHADDGGIASHAEWTLRLPFALLAIAGLLAVFALGRRFFGVRVGLLSAAVLGTCPQYCFVARQAMTDMPLAALLAAGMALLIIGGFDRERERAGVLYAGYALLGLSVVFKGLTGIFLPGMVFLIYFVLSGDWARLRRMRVLTGGLLAFAIAAPWFVYLSIASAVRRLLDDEGKTFFQRFFLHDHLYRLASGVHGDRGSFAYFIEQLGLGTHPWFAFMVGGAASSAVRLDRARPGWSREQRVELLLFVWAIGGYGLYSLSVTKFHHYALPAVPAMALLAALWIDRLAAAAREGRLAEIPGRCLALVLVLGVVLVSRDIGLMPKGLVDLFVYNYTRAFPKEAAVPGQVGYAIVFGLGSLALLGLLLAGVRQLARHMGKALVACALLSAIWGGWYFFNAMGPHWSQRALFDTYFGLRQGDEPVGAYLMNWRGETFYSRNTVTQLKNNTDLSGWLARHRDRRRFLLVEQHRLSKLKARMSAAQKRSLRILDRSCNKFYLLSIEPDRKPDPRPRREP
ncbi:MAG: glycosyltransferase family 39 protein [Deltaproteobacteria bacterium]|nr:glycosyltransferase family 39 protein [Deltaproteobacteria bacterium]